MAHKSIVTDGNTDQYICISFTFTKTPHGTTGRQQMTKEKRGLTPLTSLSEHHPQ